MTTLETGTSTSGEDYRLAYDVAPRRYELLLAPDLDASTFHGELRLELEVLATVESITLNAAELSITAPSLLPGWASEGDDTDEEPPLPCSVELDEEAERVTFGLPVELEAGRYTFRCDFDGILNDKLCGFYRSVFVDEEGTERVIATTQFEDTDARRAFPCFDEPDRKAVFSVTLDVPAGMLAVSNGPEVSSEALPHGGHRVRFGDTIAMSSYLVAFVVGPLEATAPVDVDGVPVRVVHVPGKAHLATYALEVAAHALGYFADYFAIPYPAEKLDLVAIPDFASGAMENLGCVTFREAILLADPLRVSRPELERLAEVVEHELAHMWFGDLVTMGWWNGIWLNEAFATFMALRCQDDYRPEWQCFAAFARQRAAAFAIDGLHTTRPIEFPVRHPDDAAAMFDVLTYEKGASVLWMIEQYLGEERFRDGVRTYLLRHRFANTETHDLWDALEEASGDVPIRAVMDSWIFQGGFPLLEVSAGPGDAAPGGASPAGLTLSQRPFSYLPAAAAGAALDLAGREGERGGSAIGTTWLVPVLAGPPGSGVDRGTPPGPTRLLLSGEDAFLPAGAGPTIVNSGGSGFYRVVYDAALRDGLLGELAGLSPLERYGLLSDAWAGVVAGQVGLADWLTMARRYSNETDPHVWSVLIGALGLLDLVAVEGARPALARFARALLTPQLERVGWDRVPGEDLGVPLLRASLVGALGTLAADEAVRSRCAELFAVERDAGGEGSGVDPDLVPSVLAVVADHAGRPELEILLERFRNPVDPLDERRYLNALGRLGDPGLAAEIHGLALGGIRSQDAPYLLGAMLANRPTGPATWRFVTANFDDLLARFPANSIHRMLAGISGLTGLDDDGQPALLGEVRGFLDQRITGARRRLVAQSLERLEIHVALARRLRGDLDRLLAET